MDVFSHFTLVNFYVFPRYPPIPNVLSLFHCFHMDALARFLLQRVFPRFPRLTWMISRTFHRLRASFPHFLPVACIFPLLSTGCMHAFPCFATGYERYITYLQGQLLVLTEFLFNCLRLVSYVKTGVGIRSSSISKVHCYVIFF